VLEAWICRNHEEDSVHMPTEGTTADASDFWHALWQRAFHCPETAEGYTVQVPVIGHDSTGHPQRLAQDWVEQTLTIAHQAGLTNGQAQRLVEQHAAIERQRLDAAPRRRAAAQRREAAIQARRQQRNM
jgi:hypothetical protein